MVLSYNLQKSNKVDKVCLKIFTKTFYVISDFVDIVSWYHQFHYYE